MKKTAIFGMLGLMVIGLFAAAGFASAYRGDYSVKGPECSEQRHQLIEDVFQSGDYETWKQLMTETGKSPGVLNLINEENFAKFAEAHEAGKNGDYETAAELRAEIGLNNGNGPRDGTGHGKTEGKQQGMQYKRQESRKGRI